MDDETIVTTTCALLGAAGVGTWNPTPGTVYPPTSVGIYYGAIGSDTERGIGVTLYFADVDDFANGLQGNRRLQVRFRGAKGDPKGADTLAQATYDTLNGLARASGVLLFRRVLMAQLGTDGNGRRERADSYELLLDLEA